MRRKVQKKIYWTKLKKLEQENAEIKVKNSELLDENKSLKTNLNGNKEKIDILIDNFQMILSEFRKDELEQLKNKNNNEDIASHTDNNRWPVQRGVTRLDKLSEQRE